MSPVERERNSSPVQSPDVSIDLLFKVFIKPDSALAEVVDEIVDALLRRNREFLFRRPSAFEGMDLRRDGLLGSNQPAV